LLVCQNHRRWRRLRRVARGLRLCSAQRSAEQSSAHLSGLHRCRNAGRPGARRASGARAGCARARSVPKRSAAGVSGCKRSLKAATAAAAVAAHASTVAVASRCTARKEGAATARRPCTSLFWAKCIAARAQRSSARVSERAHAAARSSRRVATCRGRSVTSGACRQRTRATADASQDARCLCFAAAEPRTYRCLTVCLHAAVFTPQTPASRA
jgi:hypothetical protein